MVPLLGIRISDASGLLHRPHYDGGDGPAAERGLVRCMHFKLFEVRVHGGVVPPGAGRSLADYGGGAGDAGASATAICGIALS